MFLSQLTCIGQSFRPPVNNFTSKQYGKDRNPENFCVTQGTKGLIYVANAGGVMEFDGNTWRFIPVKQGAYVTSLYTADNGQIFVGTLGEFGVLETSTTGHLNYKKLYPANEQNLGFGNVWRICSLNKNILFQANELIVSWDGKNTQTLEPVDGFHVLLDADKKVFVRDRAIGLQEITFEKGTLTQTIVSNDEWFTATGIFGIIPFNNKYLLVTHEQGIWECDFSFSHIKPFVSDANQLLTNGLVSGLTRLNRNEFAVTTSREGVIILNNSGQLAKVIQKQSGLNSNDIKHVYQDREDNLWVAMQNGVAHVNYLSPINYYDESSGIQGDVQAIIRFGAKIYVGTSAGLFEQSLQPDSKTEFLAVFDIPYHVWDLQKHEGALLIGTGDGLFKYSNGAYAKVFDGNVNAMVVLTNRNTIVVAGNQGIYFLDDRTFKEFTGISGANNGVVGAVRAPKPFLGDDEVWIGLFSEGVVRANLVEGVWQFEAYDDFDGLKPNAWVRPQIAGEKVVFATVDAPLYFVDEETIKADLPDSLKNNPNFYRGYFNSISVSSKIPESTTNLVAKQANKLWLVQSNQLYYLDIEKDSVAVNFPFWGVDFGRFNTLYSGTDNVLFAGTTEGMLRYQDAPYKPYKLPFSTLIRKVSNNGDVLFWGDGGSGNADSKLNYSQNTLTFEFSAPYFEDNQKIVYRWKLDGYEDDWSEWSNETKVTYTNLDEGDYTFRVEAMNIYQTVSEQATYSFSIAPPWYRTIAALIGYILVLILAIFAAVRISSAQLRAKNVRLERIVQERTAEIEKKNVALELQKDEILHQKTEIEDSINYAKRIQEAILPISSDIANAYPESFVLFRPKDIVSGDFYWFGATETHTILVCADCTGHGVPGALMSMIGCDKLNQAVLQNGLTNPAEILSFVSRGIKNSLKQDEDKDTTRDGMDAAIMSFTKDNKTIQYAGANRVLWMIRKGELQEFAPTKSAVGGFTPDEQQYILHNITPETGDRFYMTTDGYADQFGGYGGKKLKVKTLKDFLIEIHSKPMTEQSEILEARFNEWRGDLEQLDDVCVIGIRV